jgi:hypothetical protein
MKRAIHLLSFGLSFSLLGAAACTNEPVYVGSDPAQQIEVGTDDPADEGTATTTLNLPFDNAFLTGTEYTKKRTELLASINAAVDPDITADQLPFVRLDQIDLSIEWSIKNLDTEPGQARISVNGGNQYFYYVPDDFIVDPTDPDAVAPPPLAGNVPIDVPGSGTVSGVFREDTMREAALALELITRGTINPFQALLNNYEDITSTADVPFVPYPPPEDVDPVPVAPPPLPVDAFGHFVRLDVTFEADHHMVLEYAVRVRDPDGVLHDELLAADPAELMVFAPAEYVPVLPP